MKDRIKDKKWILLWKGFNPLRFGTYLCEITKLPLVILPLHRDRAFAIALFGSRSRFHDCVASGRDRHGWPWLTDRDHGNWGLPDSQLLALFCLFSFSFPLILSHFIIGPERLQKIEINAFQQRIYLVYKV